MINEFGNQTQTANDWPPDARLAADMTMQYNDVEPDLWLVYARDPSLRTWTWGPS